MNFRRFFIFVVLVALVISFTPQYSMADSGLQTKINALTAKLKNRAKQLYASLTPDENQVVDGIWTALKDYPSSTAYHYYVYPEDLTPNKAICNTNTDSGCTQQNVFDTMLKEARFMSPADPSVKYNPVLDGCIIQLDNGQTIAGHYFTETQSDIAIATAVFAKAELTPSPETSLEVPTSTVRLEWLEHAWEVLDAYPKLYNNRIIVHVDAGDYSVTNITLPGHLLYRGTVVRTVLPPDANGNIYVKTTGIGTGDKYGVARSLNLFVEPTIWENANEQLRDAIKGVSAPVLVIDRSGSLSNQPGVMQQIVNRAAEVVQAIQSSVGQAAVINFSGAGEAAIDAPFTSDSQQLLNAIQSPSTISNGTAIYDAVKAAVNLARSKGDRSMLILFTDGMNNEGSGLNEAVAYCEQQHVAVIVVGFSGTEGRNEADLTQLAASTGGFYVANESASISDILSRFSKYSADKKATQVKGGAD